MGLNILISGSIISIVAIIVGIPKVESFFDAKFVLTLFGMLNGVASMLIYSRMGDIEKPGRRGKKMKKSIFSSTIIFKPEVLMMLASIVVIIFVVLSIYISNVPQE